MPHLSSNSYGKSAVRLTKVIRKGPLHDLLEFNVAISLEGDFTRVYTHGDNAACIPTDTMKNTVYTLAQKHPFDSPESFAKILADHFLHKFPHVSAAHIDIEATPWKRISVADQPHDHSFLKTCGLRTCSLTHARNSPPQILGGLSHLEVLKTTRSAFTDFIRDEYTTLKDAPDRIFATTIEAQWTFSSPTADFNPAFKTARQTILETFATHNSLAVQQTIFAMGQAVLAAVPAITQIAFTLPNQHRILANLAPFNLTNENEIFVTTSEPFGLIKGTITRD